MKDDLGQLSSKVSADELKTHDEIRREFLNSIDEYLEEEWGLIASVKMERDVGEGYYDARIGNLHFEIKRPSDGLQAGIDDAQEYIADEQTDEIDFFTTEGIEAAHINSEGSVIKEDSLELIAPHLQTLLDEAVSNPTPEDIIDAFAPQSTRVQTFIVSLWDIFQDSQEVDRIGSAYDAWKNIYAESANLSSDARRAVNRQASEYGIDIDTKEETYAFLFVVQTYFAIFLKLFSARLAGDYDSIHKRINRGLWTNSYRQLSLETETVEHDLFDWFLYAARQSGDDSSTLGDILNRLARSIDFIDPKIVDRDILRELYQGSFDAKTRKAMGEFYTNDELASEVLDTVGYTGEEILDDDALLVDPTCGSGTFLFRAIHRFTEQAEKKGWSDADIVDGVETNIRGIDLHPFAVSMAKTNYLLALGDRAQYVEDLPVYWTDSLAPSSLPTLYGENVTVATLGTVEIPSSPSKDEKEDDEEKSKQDSADIEYSELFSNLESALADEWGKERFKQEFTDEQQKKYDRVLNELYEFFSVKIHNGMWVPAFRDVAAISKLKEQVQYLVGNPPWVRHKNVANDIREALSKDFDYYTDPWRPNLTEMRNPSSPRDYSMAFLEAGFNYLKEKDEEKGIEGGTMSFVITASVVRGLYAGEARKVLSEEKNLTKITDLSLSPRNLFADAVNTPLVFAVENRPPDGPVEMELYNREDEVLEWEIDVSELPINKHEPNSPWLIAPPEVISACRKMQDAGQRIGDVFKPTSGAKTAANPVYYVEDISTTDTPEYALAETGGGNIVRIEKELLRPMIRGENIDEWSYDVAGYHLWTHDDNGDPLDSLPDEAADYFESHKKRLEDRSDYMVSGPMNDGAPYWIIGNVKPDLYGEKVAWQEIATTVESVYLPSTVDISDNGVELDGATLIPNNKVYFFAVGDNPDAAKALTGLLNSAPARAYAGSYAMRTGGNYIQNQAWVLGLIPIPSEIPTGDVDELDELSKKCHSDGETEDRIQSINEEVAKLYDLSDDELEALEQFMDFFLAG